jgi:hypothetical protein
LLQIIQTALKPALFRFQWVDPKIYTVSKFSREQPIFKLGFPDSKQRSVFPFLILTYLLINNKY